MSFGLTFIELVV